MPGKMQHFFQTYHYQYFGHPVAKRYLNFQNLPQSCQYDNFPIPSRQFDGEILSIIHELFDLPHMFGEINHLML